MANNFKNAKVDLSTTNNTTIYTCPSATQTVIKSILVNDDSGSGDTVNFTLTSGVNVFSIYKSKSVSANETIELLSQPLIIQESEILKAQATNANRLHVIVSLLEIN